ncbi:cysteine synthase A [Mycoplasmatota bacterium WC44]
MKVVKSVLELIGETPIIDLSDYLGANVFGKCEFLNPAGSIKDRIGKRMIEDAEKKGLLTKDMEICEPSSGNTGIALSLVGAVKGYKVNISMPENMSSGRKKLISGFGANLILTPEAASVDGAVQGVNDFVCNNPNTYVPNQFENESNIDVHYETTGAEIWEQLNGKVDIFIAGIGSGGTVAGVGKYLKEKNPDLILCAVEPTGVSALLGHPPGLHKIEGIGDGFIPEILDVDAIDEVIEVNDVEAQKMAAKLRREMGLLIGVSSGGMVIAAKMMAEKYGKDKNIVVILADRAERYLDSDLFQF